MKGIKIVAGVILLCFSTFYLLGLVLTMNDASSSYFPKSYLQVESVESSPAGERLVTEWGEELSAEPGYTYYRLACTITNLSSAEYYGIPAESMYLYGDYVQAYGSEAYEGKDADHRKLFYDSARPALPGKATVVCPVYVQVEKGVSKASLLLHYSPNAEEEELVLTVPLVP